MACQFCKYCQCQCEGIPVHTPSIGGPWEFSFGGERTVMLTAGVKLGPYEILTPIGKGGMGEVWKARDPRLNRDVAIKISTQQFTVKSVVSVPPNVILNTVP